MKTFRNLGWLVFASASAVMASEPLHGFVPFAGLSVGFNKLSTSASGEVGKSGFDLGLGAVASWYRQQWVFDAGLGYGFDRISGTSSTQKIKVSTDSAWFDLGARYRIGRGVQVGALLETRFGTDQTFSETDENKKSLILMGIDARYDIPTSSRYPLRAGARVLTDLNNSKRQSWIGLASFEVGFDFWSGESKPEVTPAEYPVPEEQPAPPPEATVKTPINVRGPASVEPIARKIAPRVVLMRLPEDRIQFDTGMSHLRKERREYVQAFGALLAAQPDSWRSAVITGHTDVRGTAKVNNELSEARANTVRNTLVSAGVPAKKLAHKGMGSGDPVDPSHNAAAWQRNRRVEIEFRGVDDPDRLVDEINSVDRKFFP